MKKDEIKASFTRDLFDYLNGKAQQHEMSFQEYVSMLAFQATHNTDVIRSIAGWFRRGFKFKDNEFCIGRVIAPKYADLLPEGKLSIRRSLKLQPKEYLRVCEVASALVCPPATAATILLNAARTFELDIITDTEDTQDSETQVLVKVGESGTL